MVGTELVGVFRVMKQVVSIRKLGKLSTQPLCECVLSQGVWVAMHRSGKRIPELTVVVVMKVWVTNRLKRCYENRTGTV